jgi:DNA-binding transcriptional MerR regulator
MRMAELSEHSGVTVPSIKFYVREGLVAPGERTSPNQSTYDESHSERLRLVRALIEVGGLTVAAARAVLAAIDNTAMPLDWAFGIAQRAASKSIPAADVAPGPEAVSAIDELATGLGWNVDSENPGRAIAARVIETYRGVGQEELIGVLPAYAQAATIVAAADLAAVGARTDRAAMAETVVVGTVLGDALFAGLRRMAQENLSHSLYPTPEIPEGMEPEC